MNTEMIIQLPHVLKELDDITVTLSEHLWVHPLSNNSTDRRHISTSGVNKNQLHGFDLKEILMTTEAKYLYILVRTDMASLGRGKSVAQGAHAANQFIWDMVIAPMIAQQPAYSAALEWSRSAGGFGTTIALAATLPQMQRAVRIARSMGFPAQLVEDPEYPLADGDTLHVLRNVVTTAYLFGSRDELSIALGDLPLLRNDPVGRGVE